MTWKNRAVIAALLTVVGCADEDQWTADRPMPVVASGIVTLEGAPVEGAVVTFAPVEGTHAAVGRTDSDGGFELTTFAGGDGAVPGEYTVTIAKTVIEFEPNPQDPETLPPLYHAEQSMIPLKYAAPQKSGLTATIYEDGNQALIFNLAGGPESKKVLVPRRGT